MKNNNSNFDRAVSSFRTSIRRRITRTGRVSAVDLASVANWIVGSPRGAAVREAFRQLQSDKVITATNATVINPRNRHQVTVYGRA
jgi:hypothetical protein